MDAGGVQGLVAAATAFPENAAVQLSVLLCIIPLSLDNSMIQIGVAEHVLCHVMTALRIHVDHADVQAKGLVVLGVLAQARSLPLLRHPYPSSIAQPPASASDYAGTLCEEQQLLVSFHHSSNCIPGRSLVI